MWTEGRRSRSLQSPFEARKRAKNIYLKYWLGGSGLDEVGSEQRSGAKLCWDSKEPWRSVSAGYFLVAAVSALENEDEGVKKGQMPIQGRNSRHQWVFLAENGNGRSVLNRTVKVLGNPSPAFQIHVTTDSNYAYRKICKLTTEPWRNSNPEPSIASTDILTILHRTASAECSKARELSRIFRRMRWNSHPRRHG